MFLDNTEINCLQIVMRTIRARQKLINGKDRWIECLEGCEISIIAYFNISLYFRTFLLRNYVSMGDSHLNIWKCIRDHPEDT